MAHVCFMCARSVDAVFTRVPPSVFISKHTHTLTHGAECNFIYRRQSLVAVVSNTYTHKQHMRRTQSLQSDVVCTRSFRKVNFSKTAKCKSCHSIRSNHRNITPITSRHVGFKCGNIYAPDDTATALID